MHEENKVEQMLIYTIVYNKKTSEQDIIWLDMKKMLNNQEVLNFGLDDWLKGQFSIICVQAKDL